MTDSELDEKVDVILGGLECGNALNCADYVHEIADELTRLRSEHAAQAKELREPKQTLGAQIKDKRIELGLSLRDLAGLTGVAFNLIARLERGEGDLTPRNEGRMRGWLRSEADPRDATIATQREEIERLRREAEQWAQEARAQKATVHEIYQLITGATGEPGDWNGAKPVREFIAELKQVLGPFAAFEAVINRHYHDETDDHAYCAAESHSGAAEIQLGDLRAAAATIKKLEG